jgi:hypothetical protein
MATLVAESELNARAAVDKMLPVAVAPVVTDDALEEINPSDLKSATSVEDFTATPVEEAVVPRCSVSTVGAAALATGVDTTENNPAVSADTATTAMRFLSVFVDICFLSLVGLRYFLSPARESFDPLIPFSPGTHV